MIVKRERNKIWAKWWSQLGGECCWFTVKQYKQVTIRNMNQSNPLMPLNFTSPNLSGDFVRRGRWPSAVVHHVWNNINTYISLLIQLIIKLLLVALFTVYFTHHFATAASSLVAHDYIFGYLQLLRRSGETNWLSRPCRDAGTALNIHRKPKLFH